MMKRPYISETNTIKDDEYETILNKYSECKM